jgi:hypothetical protein
MEEMAGSFGGSGSSYDLSNTSGVDGSDGFSFSGHTFNTGSGGNGLTISTPILLGGLGLLALLIWSKK